MVARGTDSEQLADLEALRDAYRSLPEFQGFTPIPAGGPPAEVLSRLQEAITRSGGGTPAQEFFRRPGPARGEGPAAG